MLRILLVVQVVHCSACIQLPTLFGQLIRKICSDRPYFHTSLRGGGLIMRTEFNIPIAIKSMISAVPP